MSILDGRALAARLKEELRAEVERLRKITGKVPVLRNIIVGANAGACAYANSQRRVAEQVGVDYALEALPDRVSQQEFQAVIQRLNNDAAVNGIMIHKPLPEHLAFGDLANAVDIAKDIEGINVANIGKMILGETRMIPCTPAAVMEHIRLTGVDIRGKEAVVVGHSTIVGKPLSLLLLRKMATVTVCHVATSEAGRLAEHVRRADILAVAVGCPELIKGAWIKEGAIVLDVGINCRDGRIVGDVEFAAAAQRAAFITPVPGGIGPVTVVMLMRNGVEAFKCQNGLE